MRYLYLLLTSVLASIPNLSDVPDHLRHDVLSDFSENELVPIMTVCKGAMRVLLPYIQSSKAAWMSTVDPDIHAKFMEDLLSHCRDPKYFFFEPLNRNLFKKNKLLQNNSLKIKWKRRGICYFSTRKYISKLNEIDDDDFFQDCIAMWKLGETEKVKDLVSKWLTLNYRPFEILDSSAQLHKAFKDHASIQSQLNLIQYSTSMKNLDAVLFKKNEIVWFQALYWSIVRLKVSYDYIKEKIGFPKLFLLIDLFWYIFLSLIKLAV